jgi:hypothetical protein
MMKNYKKRVNIITQILLTVNIIFLSVFNGFANGKSNETSENYGALSFVSSNPVSGATGIARGANIVLTFNEAVASSTVNATNIKVSGNLTGVIAASFSGGGTTQITINPTTDFKPGELITVTLVSGLQSLSTNEGLTNPYTIQFTAIATNNIYLSEKIQEESSIKIGSIKKCKSIYPADMDNDGDIDIVAVSEDGADNDDASVINKYVVWYENTGLVDVGGGVLEPNFTIHRIPLILSISGAHSVVATDVNEDGHMDILVSGWNLLTVAPSRLYILNDGNNDFSVSGNQFFNPTNSEKLRSRSIAAADMNNDGHMDMISFWGDDNFNSNSIAVHSNIGTNGYTGLNRSITSSQGFWGLYTADINSDGYLDVVSSIWPNSNRVSYHLNNGDGSFALENDIDIALSKPRGVSSIDLDGDGDLDIIAAAVDNNSIFWYENTGTPSTPNFVKRTIDDTLTSAQELHASDIDGDGDIDITAVGNFFGVKIYVNNGDKTFDIRVVANTTPVDIKSRNVKTVDLDGDGDLDIITTVTGDNGGVFWYKNGSNIPLSFVSSTPADAATNVTNTTIVLNFDEKVKASTINNTNITVSGSISGTVAGSFSGQDTNEVTFTPTGGNLPYNEVITVTITNGLTSLTDDVLSNPTSFTFTTAIEPLSFLSMNPADNAVGVAVDVPIVLNFDANVLGSTINATNIAVSGSSSGTIAGTFSGQGTAQVTFTPNSDFNYSEVITVTLTNGLTSFTGGALSNPTSSLTFTTELQQILVSPKVFLQGPYDTTSDLMKDDLRVAGVIPTTSPYLDALTANASVFTTTGNNAIVDWVYVQLRDKTDIATIIASTSAFVQRDGDVVGVDGASPVEFTVGSDNYYVSISHRNHIDIATDATVSLSASTTVVDMTLVNNLRGTINAVKLLETGVYGMFSGDVNNDASVLTTDYNQTIGFLNSSGYLSHDADMNGTVLTTDLSLFIITSLNAGRQF